MKPLLTITLLLLLVVSCRKEDATRGQEKGYLQQVQMSLQDSMRAPDYRNLDFTRAVQTWVNEDTVYLRVPFEGQELESAFVLLLTTEDGHIVNGRIVTLAKDTAPGKEWKSFEGQVAIRSLQGSELLQSPVESGYIVALHPERFATLTARTETLATVAPPEYTELPEVIVVGTRTSGGMSYGDWLFLQSFFGDGSGGASGWYGSADGAGGGSYNGDTYGEGSLAKESPILVDFEYQAQRPAIDIEKYLECFSAIPDAGATCSIEIFADIPVDKDPNKLFNWETESPGHTFIQIKKSNGNQSVMQNIGFYPETNWKSILSPGPLKGKFCDNSEHELNASFKMAVNPGNFKSILTEILYLARFVKYDIDEYNCTDFALDVFNKVRTDKLEIPMYDIPGGITAAGTRTPQGLYNKLKSMLQSNHPEAPNITIPGYKGWVAKSKGPCN
jgi:hypothetical protein